MRALVYTGTEQIEIQNVPDPVCGSGEVIVKVGAVGICGSEVEAYLGKSRKRVPPLVMGHEFTGVVSEVGSGVTNARVGDRVAVQPLFSCFDCPECHAGKTNICRNRKLMSIEVPGGYAEYAAVPASALFPLSNDISFELGTLAEPLANAVHILERARYRIGEKLVILGGGTIGALVLILARIIGINDAVVIEPNAAKHATLASLGAEMVLDPREEDSLKRVMDWSCGGANVVVDASGAASARKFAIECAAPDASIVFVGQGSASSDADHRDILTKELTIKGSYAYTNNDFLRSLRILATYGAKLGSIVSTIRMEVGPRAFAQLVSGKGNEIKVVMIP